MDRDLTAPRRRRLGRTLAGAVIALAFVVAACGGGGGGGGGVDYDKIVAEIQATFGTTMSSGVVEGDTITVTIDNNWSPLGARLFMCSNITTILERNETPDTLVIILNERGEELSRSTDCKGS